MLKRLYRILFTLLGMLCGGGISLFILHVIRMLAGTDSLAPVFEVGIPAVLIIAIGLIFFIIAPPIARSFLKATQELETSLQKVPLQEFICDTLGLLVGLIFAFLISQLWTGLEVPLLSTVLSVLVYIALGYTGLYLGRRKSSDIAASVRGFATGRSQADKPAKQKRGKEKQDKSPKVLDTSVIIDGRIADIMKTGFIEGRIVIPEFVLVELRHIADSSDSLKRARGRRGLDILNKIQDQYGIEIYDTGRDKFLEDIEEVDVKLLELAAHMGGKVVTNDYNLNKVASIKGVEVLNINELANTLKPVVLPGEEMTVTPVREGKERSQALAYLDDGTMIVVEDGRSYMDKEISVIVTSVLQTAAGRMIFARVK